MYYSTHGCCPFQLEHISLVSRNDIEWCYTWYAVDIKALNKNMHFLDKCIVLQVCMTLALFKQHIVQLTTKLRQQGYHRDINLGEVIAETIVFSPEACGRKCEANPFCDSVMLVGNLCRMFATLHCPVGQTVCLYIYTHIVAIST